MRDRGMQMFIVMMLASSLGTGADAVTPGPADWTTYGHDARRTFASGGCVDGSRRDCRRLKID